MCNQGIFVWLYLTFLKIVNSGGIEKKIKSATAMDKIKIKLALSIIFSKDFWVNDWKFLSRLSCSAFLDRSTASSFFSWSSIPQTRLNRCFFIDNFVDPFSLLSGEILLTAGFQYAFLEPRSISISCPNSLGSNSAALLSTAFASKLCASSSRLDSTFRVQNVVLINF